MSPAIVHFKNGNPIRYAFPRPEKVIGYISENNQTAALVIKKNITDDAIAEQKIFAIDGLFCTYNPKTTESKKLPYTAIKIRASYHPIKKSLATIAISGNKNATRRLVKTAPENNAIAPMGAKLGGKSIIPK